MAHQHYSTLLQSHPLRRRTLESSTLQSPIQRRPLHSAADRTVTPPANPLQSADPFVDVWYLPPPVASCWYRLLCSVLLPTDPFRHGPHCSVAGRLVMLVLNSLIALNITVPIRQQKHYQDYFKVSYTHHGQGMAGRRACSVADRRCGTGWISSPVQAVVCSKTWYFWVRLAGFRILGED